MGFFSFLHSSPGLLEQHLTGPISKHFWVMGRQGDEKMNSGDKLAFWDVGPMRVTQITESLKKYIVL